MFLATLPAAAAAIRLPGLRVGRAGHAQMVVEPAINAPSAPTSRRFAKKRLNVRIDDTWYDLTNWRAAHPAGTHRIDAYDGADATEVMYAFHSDRAMSMMQRAAEVEAAQTNVAPPAASSYAFRALREKLVADGWWRVSPLMEARKLLPWFSFTALGAVRARAVGLAAALGATRLRPRDRQHAVGVALARLRPRALAVGVDDARLRRARRRDDDDVVVDGALQFGAILLQFSDARAHRLQKHNMHHALTNEVGYDEDVALEPALYLWRPDPKNDSPLRKLEHWYWPLPFSILFLYWRFDSMEVRAAAQEVGQARAPRRPLCRLPLPLPPEDFLLRDLALGVADRHRRHRHAPERGDVSGRLAAASTTSSRRSSARPATAKLELVLVDPVGRCAPRQRLTATHTQLSHPICLPVPQGWTAARVDPPLPDDAAAATKSSRPSSRPSPTRTTRLPREWRVGDLQAECRPAADAVDGRAAAGLDPDSTPIFKQI